MNHRTFGLGFTALLLTSAAACGGGDQNTPPQNPSTTTTTSAPYTQAPQGESTTTQSPATASPSSMYGQGTMSGQQQGALPPDGMQAGSGNMEPQGTTSTMTGATTSGASAATATSGTSDTSVNDAQIAAVIDAANAGEIEQARVAVKKAKSAKVKQLAEHMIMDHERAQTSLRSVDTKAGLTPQEGTQSDQIKEGSQRVLTSIDSKTGADFDHTYIDAQVDEHQKVLESIDRFIPQAQNADLKSLLQQIRAKVSAHLRDARDIQQELTK
jgi:putative membrane protein